MGLVSRIGNFVQQNQTGLLTAVGVVGVISTAMLTARATFKASVLLMDAVHELEKDPDPKELTLKDGIKLVWKLYIPPVGVGVLTITSIVLANRLAGKQAAALAAAYSLSEQAFSEYKDKVIEKIGPKKETDIRDELAQERVNKNPPKEIIVTGTGDVLCMDAMTGRYFESSVEKIRAAENAVNFVIVNEMACSLSTFYDEIGLRPTGMSDLLGFNFDNRCYVEFTTTMTEDQKRPCMVIDFKYAPIPRYTKLWG